MVQSEAAPAAVVGGTPPGPRARRWPRLPVLLLLAAGLATGAACGGSGSGSNNGVASIKTASDKSTDSDSADNDQDKKGKTNPEDAMLAFARCMRENGVDMPDPDTSGGNGAVTFSAGASAGGERFAVDSNKFQEADKACRDLLGNAGPQNLSPKEQQEAQDRALAFSRCMRERGINMPDPTFGEGGMMMRIDEGTGIDPTDPKFEEAQKACGSAFGPGGPGLSVGGAGQAHGGAPGEGPKGAILFGGPAASTSGGGGK